MLAISEQFKNKTMPMNGYLKGGGDGGAGAQADATNKATELQRQIWQTNMGNLAPFTGLAQQGVNQLQALSSLQGQESALSGFFNSGLYKSQADQARYQMLNAAEATGGLGTTATGNQLSSISPMLGQDFLNGQMQNHSNLANIGLGALTGQANLSQSYGNNMSQLYQQQANTAAANANRPSGLRQGMTGLFGGAAAGAQLGTLVPGVGTGIGAAVGGGIGLLGSLF